ncbi:unnamed protein product [Caenorhabditis bovis]|uniref:Uncharacterized protein n=1 Tax=Caenorhabditis bovis TaxID=2654633 RepID=A0A8S1EIX0_9PELO|nr:unnamed protein product [Caenorhabditis bovis]
MQSRFAVNILVVFLAILCLNFHVEASPRQQMRYSNGLPAYAPHALYRFYQSRQFAPLPLQKRNNAEVVNHILKNFGTLDRLGDVGRK